MFYRNVSVAANMLLLKRPALFPILERFGVESVSGRTASTASPAARAEQRLRSPSTSAVRFDGIVQNAWSSGIGFVVPAPTARLRGLWSDCFQYLPRSPRSLQFPVSYRTDALKTWRRPEARSQGRADGIDRCCGRFEMHHWPLRNA